MKTIEDIAHRAADEIVNTAKQDVDRVEVIVRQAIRDALHQTWDGLATEQSDVAPVTKTGKKNPNRFYVSE